MWIPQLLLPALLVVAACGGSGAGSDPDNSDTDVAPDAGPHSPDAGSVAEPVLTTSGGLGRDLVTQLAKRDQGGLLVLGQADDDLDLGGGARDVRSGMLQLWIAAYAADGTHVFDHILRPLADQAVGYVTQPGDVAPDGQGGFWVAATLIGGIAVDGHDIELPANRKAHVLLHFDAAGRLIAHSLYSFVEPGTGLGERQLLAYDGAGSLYLAAYLLSSLPGPAAPLGMTIAASGWHVAKLDAATGAGRWIAPVSGYNVKLTDLAASTSKVWIAGTMWDRATVRDLTLERDSFKAAPFAAALGPLATDTASGFVIDECDCAPTHSVSIDLASDGDLAATWLRSRTGGTVRAVVARLSPSGIVDWTVEASTPAMTVGALAVHDDQLIVAGYDTGGTLGGQALTGQRGPLLAALAWSSGTVLRAHTQASETTDSWKAATAVGDRIVVAGGFRGPVDLGGAAPFKANGLADLVFGWFPLPL